MSFSDENNINNHQFNNSAGLHELIESFHSAVRAAMNKRDTLSETTAAEIKRLEEYESRLAELRNGRA